MARKIQLSILPKSLPTREGVVVDAVILPAREVGGDFYDFFQIDERRVGVTIADVSGKGVPAAFFMLIARTLLRATALFGLAPSACLTKVNDILSAENDQMLFVTLFYGILDIETGRFTYANAGHNWPVTLHADGSVAMLDGTGGTALAVIEGLAFEEKSIDLAPGDLMLLYTDGVTEAFNPASEEFSDARLRDLVATMGQTPTWNVPHMVLGAVKAFEDGTQQSDDITCVVLGFRRD